MKFIPNLEASFTLPLSLRYTCQYDVGKRLYKQLVGRWCVWTSYMFADMEDVGFGQCLLQFKYRK